MINSGSNSSTLSYGAFRNRFKQVAVNAGATETTIYVAGLLEQVTRGSLIEYRHRIQGGTGTAAIYTRRSGSSTVTDTVYVHSDHLGSPELLTDAAGVEVLRLSFGAYGERRDGTDWDGAVSAPDLTTIANTSRHGFTDHEHLDAVGLIHMNGRVYEPVVGRFLGVDPIVQLGSSQSPNSYAYVWNNPLTYTDPSGFDVTRIFPIDPCGNVIVTCSTGPPPIFEPPAGAALVPGAPPFIPGTVPSDGQSFGGTAVMFGVGIGGQSSIGEPLPTATVAAIATTSVYFETDVYDNPVFVEVPVDQTEQVENELTEARLGVAAVAATLFPLQRLAVTPIVSLVRYLRALRAARGAAATAKELNKIAHVFTRAEKNLDALVRASGGSELNALRGIQAAANQALAEGRIVVGPNGILPGNGLGAILNVNGVNVQLVGGRVINGVVELGSFVGL